MVHSRLMPGAGSGVAVTDQSGSLRAAKYMPPTLAPPSPLLLARRLLDRVRVHHGVHHLVLEELDKRAGSSPEWARAAAGRTKMDIDLHPDRRAPSTAQGHAVQHACRDAARTAAHSDRLRG